MKAIILAAGKGTRLEPITDNRPKHILEIAGKTILQRIMDELIKHDGINEIVIVTHHYEKQIIEHISNLYPNLISNKITFHHQTQPDGTGGAIKSVFANNQDYDNSFLVIYGDLILGTGIENIIQLFNENPNTGAILGAVVGNPENYGCLMVENNQVMGIIEKMPNAPKDSVVNAGVYLFPKESIKYLEKLEYSERNELELTDLIGYSVKEGVTFELIRLEKGWFDVGRPWELLNSNEFLIDNEKQSFEQLGEIEANVTIKGKVYLAKNAKLLSGTYIEGDVYIDEGTILGPNCYIRGQTYIGKNVRIGNACEIKNSVIYEGTHIAHLSYVGDSIIGLNCNFGAGTITANLRHDNANIKVSVKDNRILTDRRKLGVIMGDNVKTGIGVSILPGIKISSNSRINAGDLVARDR